MSSAAADSSPAKAKLSSMEKAKQTYARCKMPLIMGGLALGVYAGCLPGSWVWFSWHPFLMSVSLLALATPATLIKKIGGYDNTKMHGQLLAAATALMMVGGYVIWSNKNTFGKPHYTSYHSWAGLSTMAGFIGLALVGLAGLHPDFGVLKTNKTVRKVHKFSGKAVIALGYVAIMQGLWQMTSGRGNGFVMVDAGVATFLSVAAIYALL